ncbi:MAG: carboxylesterase family protein [Eubacterium sp.]|nr:carboxylesterase family protein [Eubacterium sp.]
MKTKKWFFIPLVILALVYFVVLELSKNTIVGWIAAIFVISAFVFLRIKFLEQKKAGVRFLSWLCLIVILGGVMYLTAPPYKALPAVDVKNPETTDIVSVEQGELTGVFNEDKSVEVYTGVPFAKPPVDELRWREPEDPDSWDGVRVCDHFAPMSMQERMPEIMNSLIDIFGYHNYSVSLKDNYREPISEDSLYLNIWKPAGDISGAPVLVFIHGGALTSGQSSSLQFRGEEYAKQGIVFVTITYRLGIFGYLATDELAQESPNGTTGNYGLLDQIQALKWINRNISAFGGDASKITIAGESAGSSSVNALCVSPLAKGLFRYAIGESSGITPKVPYHTFRYLDEAKDTGDRIMEEFSADSPDALRSIDAKTLLSSKNSNSSMTVDGYAITEQPYLTYEKGENNEQALLNGFNTHEANVFNLFSKVTKDNYNESLQRIAGDYADELEALYPYDSKELDYDFFLVEQGGEGKGTADFLISCAWFAYSHYTWSNYAADEGIPVYQYCFAKDNAGLRANHGGEMPYAYGNLHRSAVKYDDSDYAVSSAMQAYWINFIKTGNPNGENLPEWKPFASDRSKVLEFNDEISMQDNMYNDVYPILDKYQNSIAR